MNSPSDWELVARARVGDDQAFGVLVRRYEQGLIAFCHRMVGSRDDAEDLYRSDDVPLSLHEDLPLDIWIENLNSGEEAVFRELLLAYAMED